jgi:mannose-6-phosphate isomerase-like protein (cupin superfamily)
MTTATTTGGPLEGRAARHAVAQLDELPPIDCSCGTTRRAFVDDPDGVASMHLLHVSKAVAHHHQQATELYLILEGEGEVELDGVRYAARPLSAFLIKPGCVHRAIGDLTAIVVALPAADPSDEIIDA